MNNIYIYSIYTNIYIYIQIRELCNNVEAHNEDKMRAHPLDIIYDNAALHFQKRRTSSPSDTYTSILSSIYLLLGSSLSLFLSIYLSLHLSFLSRFSLFFFLLYTYIL